MEGFAIRAFVSRMRSADVVRCWPFNENTRDDSMRAMLPPITVKKFRWWFDELKSVRSGSEIEHGELVEEAGEDDLDLEIEKASAGRGKVKVPKKRSIVEIFAVAPQVERVESDDDYMDEINSDGDDIVEEVHEGSNVKFSVLRDSLLNSRNAKTMTKKKKKKKVTLMKPNMEKKLTIINKDKKKTTKKKRRVNKCVDTFNGVKKIKKHGEQPPNNPFSRPRSSMDKELQKDIPTHKKKPRMKRPLSLKQTRTMTASKLMAENQKAVIPFHGILKNRTKLSQEESSSNCFMWNPTQEKVCGNAQTNNRVTFSGKDDTRQRGKFSPPIRCSDFHNFFNLNAEVSSAFGNVPLTERVKALSAMEVGGVNGMVSDSTRNEITAQPVVKKQLSIMCDDASTSSFQECKTYSKDCSFDRCVIEGQDVESSDSLCSFERGYGIQSNDQFYSCNPQFLSMSRDAYRNRPDNQAIPHLTHSSSATDPVPTLRAVCPMDCVPAFHQPSHTANENLSGHAMHYLPFLSSSPQELMHTMSSTPDGGDKNVFHGYAQLPVNSLGELIKSTGNVCRAMKNADAITWKERESQKGERLKQANVKDGAKSNHNCPLPSRLGIFEYQDTGRRSINLGNDVAKIQQDGNSNYIPQHDTHQSTMRLMGKEFKVERRDLQRLEDGKFWTDKQIIAEHCNPNGHNQGEFDVDAVKGKLKGPASCSLDAVNQVVPEHRIHLDRLNRQIDAMRHQSRLYALTLRQSHYPGCYSISSHPPSASSVAPNSQFVFNELENLSRATKSAFNIPLLHPALGGHQSYNNPDGSSHPSTMLRASCQTESSLYFSREDSTQIGSCSRPAQLNALTSTTLAKCSPNQMQLGLTLNAATKNMHEHRMKYKEMINSRISYAGLGLGRKRKKRFAAASDGSVNPKKILNFGYQKDFNGSVTAHDNFEGGPLDSPEAFETERCYRF